VTSKFNLLQEDPYFNISANWFFSLDW